METGNSTPSSNPKCGNAGPTQTLISDPLKEVLSGCACVLHHVLTQIVANVAVHVYAKLNLGFSCSALICTTTGRPPAHGINSNLVPRGLQTINFAGKLKLRNGLYSKEEKGY